MLNSPKRGLSTFTSHLKATRGEGGKSQKLDKKMLINMGFELFETPDGHVSIRPPTQQALGKLGNSETRNCKVILLIF